MAAILHGADAQLDSRGWAIAAASHDGSSDHQVEAGRLLALAGLDESVLRCPPAWPEHRHTLASIRRPSRLAHNCSGKHAAFLLAQTVLGEPPERYLDPYGPLQQLVRRTLEECAVAMLSAASVDGCGAPAWELPLDRLAFMFARAGCDAAGNTQTDAPGVTSAAALTTIAASMRAHPELVGGELTDDTMLMRSDQRVIAKRGAEAVFAAATADGMGVAIKLTDGGARGIRPVAATILRALGALVPDAMVSPPVLGGGRPHGEVRVTGAVHDLAARAASDPLDA